MKMLETAEEYWPGSMRAGQLPLDYFPLVSLTLIQALAFTARDTRRGKVKQVRIAAALDVDQSTIAYFEKGHWPRKRDLEQTICAYANELGMEPAELFRKGIERWEAERTGDPLEEIDDDPPSAAPGESDSAQNGHAKPSPPAAEESTG